MNSKALRESYIDFFLNKSHQVIKAAPLFNPNDPSLLFTNAGMNQFKNVLLDIETPIYTRLVNSQPCIRVSGKHNDLEEVGVDHYHHTLFEMLGNWSFGDYGKKEAIVWAWEWITEVLKLPVDKLYATYYHKDLESRDIWIQETSINPAHVLAFEEKDNFWEMGNTGPCGPCSEIHFDKGPAACDRNNDPDQGSCVNGGSGRFVELWNLVFIQFNREADQTLTPLKKLSIDTGAGLERLAAIMQNKNSNYETDLFENIIQSIEKQSGIAYQSDESGTSHRVIADHTRALCFAIADGILPSNESRGYVLRRLVRRAARYASKINIDTPILHHLADTICEQYSPIYPQLNSEKEQIKQILLKEEKQFLMTLKKGLKHFEKIAANTQKISGEEAFKLYDTYGFPIDLTQLVALEKHLSVDLETFEKALEDQKQRSRKASNKIENTPNLQFDSPEGFNSTGKLHNSVYIQEAGGGESKLPENDYERFLLAQHHSAVHLLLQHLKQNLGSQVRQAGSMIYLNKFRFDFTHERSIDAKTLARIESAINQSIQAALAVEVNEMPLAEAKAIGATATFGEKYGENVRVVKIGSDSLELCGGNHIQNTQWIEKVKLTKCKSISAGTKRIEGIASEKFVEAYEAHEKQKLIESIQQKLKNSTNQIPGNLETMDMTELLAYQASLNSKTKPIENLDFSETFIDEFKKENLFTNQNDFRVYAKVFNNESIHYLKSLADILAKENKSLIILGGSNGDKASWIVKSNNAVDANKVLQQLLKISEGKGGGRHHFAQAGQANPEKMQAALTECLKIYNTQ